MNQSYSNRRICKFVFGDGKKFQSHSDQSESSREICVTSLGGGKKHEWDISQSESSKSAERNINPYDFEPQEGAIFNLNQSDNSIRFNLESGKISPTLTRHKAVLIRQILEKISVKLINNKNFQMSNSEFNLPSTSIQADKQTVTEADRNRPKRGRSDGGSQQIKRKKLRQTSVPNLRRNYAKMLANFRLERATKAARVSIMVNEVNSRATRSTPIVSEDKRSFTTGLSDLLSAGRANIGGFAIRTIEKMYSGQRQRGIHSARELYRKFLGRCHSHQGLRHNR